MLASVKSIFPKYKNIHLSIIMLLLVIHGWIQIDIENQKQNQIKTIPSVTSIHMFQVMAFGDPIAFSQIMLIWLQQFETHKGMTLPLDSLNYVRLSNWLNASVSLYGHSTNSFELAQVYILVQDKNKQKIMMDFIMNAFIKEPEKGWPYALHTIYICQYIRKDLELATDYLDRSIVYFPSDVKRMLFPADYNKNVY